MADNNHVATSKNEAASHQLEQFIKEGYKILIDTCSLLMDSCENFWINIIPFLEKYNSKVIVPLRCGQELENINKTIFAFAKKINDTFIISNSIEILKSLLSSTE